MHASAFVACCGVLFSGCFQPMAHAERRARRVRHSRKSGLRLVQQSVCMRRRAAHQKGQAANASCQAATTAHHAVLQSIATAERIWELSEAAASRSPTSTTHAAKATNSPRVRPFTQIPLLFRLLHLYPSMSHVLHVRGGARSPRRQGRWRGVLIKMTLLYISVRDRFSLFHDQDTSLGPRSHLKHTHTGAAFQKEWQRPTLQ